jgi:hypothetical protein
VNSLLLFLVIVWVRSEIGWSRSAVRRGAVGRGAIRRGVVRRGVLCRGVVRRGALRRGVLRRGAVRRGVVRRGVLCRGAARRGALCRGESQTRPYYRPYYPYRYGCSIWGQKKIVTGDYKEPIQDKQRLFQSEPEARDCQPG